MNIQTLNRYQAFAGHLLISAGIALSSTALVFLMWYPGLLAHASGVRNIFLMLISVDMVLGPVITLIIFNPLKKELKRDLAIVALIQVTALLYGLHAVFQARPVYMVFNVDRFDLVYANEITEKNLAKASSGEFQSMPLFGYKLVGARSPTDPKERSAMLMGALSGGSDLPQMPQYYLPYAELKADIPKRIQPLPSLKEFNQDKQADVDALVERYRQAGNEIGYFPMKAKVNDLTVVVNRSTGAVVEMLELKPWK